MPKLKPKDFLINWVPGGVGPRRRQLEILAPGGAAVEPVALVRPWAGAPLGHAGGEGALRVVLALPVNNAKYYEKFHRVTHHV